MTADEIYIALATVLETTPLHKTRVVAEHDCAGIGREYEPRSFRLAMRNGEHVLIISDEP